MKLDRRELFRECARLLAATGIGGTCLGLWLRGRGRAAAENPCPSGGACRECAALAECALPRGLSAREALGKNDGTGPEKRNG